MGKSTARWSKLHSTSTVGFLGKSTARWSKLHSTSTDDPAEKEEQISWITHKILFFWEFQRQIYGVWWGSFIHGCQNCILHVRRNNSRKIWCWVKKFTVLSLLNYNQSMFGVFAEKIRHGGQNCISRKEMIIPRKNKHFEQNRNFDYFGNWSVKFTELGESIMHGCQNWILHVRKNSSRKNWCRGKTFLFLSLLKFNQNMFGVLAENIRHGVQNCLSRLQMILPRKKNKSLE